MIEGIVVWQCTFTGSCFPGRDGENEEQEPIENKQKGKESKVHV